VNATAIGLSVAGGVVFLIIIGVLGYKYYPFGYPWGYKRRTLSAPADALDTGRTLSPPRTHSYEPAETLSAPPPYEPV